MLNLTALLNELEKVKKLPWKLSLVAIALGFSVATALTITCTYLLAPDPQSYRALDTVAVGAAFERQERVSLAKEAIEQIVSRNIFNKEGKTGEEEEGQAGEEQQEAASSHTPVKTNLPLKLLGTIYSGDPVSGIALIEDSNKKNLNSFFVGDPLAADARLLEIHREKIIIQRPGRLEFLELEKKELTSSRRKKAAETASLAPAKSPYAVEPPPDQYKEEGFERSGASIVMSSDFRKKLLTSDFAKVLQDAKAEPYLLGNELSGFRLTRIRQDSIYQKAGLQNGDIIKEINGVSLVDTAQAIKLLNSLRGENELEVRLEREGTTQTINLQVR